ncbi:hypothetical protein B0I35DRAFT_407314 [Stachybotrys elegans]|uniref:DUF7730 domain-containing protein n=1 Tax=Stachybotrys elegans TaxID=80388 RepID=A0A8K0WU82_9HYPO|nr:hypothetical protein B0I35DRAFT_407314 [Stachybotrys elegans]
MSDSIRGTMKRAWGRQKPDPSADNADQEPLPPPFLPDPRPRSLTPPPSRGMPAQKSLLLAGLPAEIRRQILMQAFGGRVLHMNLIEEHPVVGGLASKSNAQRQKRGSRAASGLRVDFESPKRWVWSGCLCQRNHPPAASIKPEEWTGHWVGPWADKCLETRVTHSVEPRSQWPQKYQIGIMGWLLSCRQAYLEGIDILYNTNMFQIQGRFLISTIDQLLLPQRLASISYLELNLTTGYDTSFEYRKDRMATDTFTALEKILTCMPALKRLFISIKLKTSLEGIWMRETYMKILGSVDMFCRGQLDSNMKLEVPLTLALPNAAILPIKVDEAIRLDSERDYTQPFLLWRDLGDEQGSIQLRYSTYPKAPLRGLGPGESSRDAKPSRGYWIMDGQRRDIPGSEEMLPRHQGVFYPALDLSIRDDMITDEPQ